MTRTAAIIIYCLFLSCAFRLSGDEARVLFYSDFGEGPAGGLPAMEEDGGPWRALTGSESGIEVVADSEGWFGDDAGNQVLSIRDGSGFGLFADLTEPAEVVTLSVDFIGRNSPNDNRWANFNFLTAPTGTGNRAHVLAFNLIAEQIRGAYIDYGDNGVRMRIDTIVNNSAEPVTYQRPDGGTEALGPGRAAIWIDGMLRFTDYNWARSNEAPDPVSSLWVQADGNAVVSFDLNEFLVLEGAHVVGDPGPVEPAREPPMVSLGEDGLLEYSTDESGNRIPDFSNSGYMGGGVSIPDVPVRKTLHPAPGDDTDRIQAAIDEVGAMPLDEHGFRGALLLTAGEYQVAGSLHILHSGVVLRGEGREEDGTILRATGTEQRTLIQVGSLDSWSEVPGSRRDLIEDYVPVGARSFLVDGASSYEPGQKVIVHRPSTAEWISAIGMDEIPERDDGRPVTQWQPGAYDQFYDRIVTAVEGNRITVDAPLVNAFEQQYGGGWIYRYVWPERINQVGIERIRSVSDYAHETDLDHGFSFIRFDSVQNGWVRETTAVHYIFGNTEIHRNAKWITVKDSSNLDPISPIAGSMRYPFYITGSLSLVKNCYARQARHDFGTNSRTNGPNVFLHCLGEESYNDTGPHHRWATGTLYDNVHIPHQTIAVQNRLNLGSGHGWAGANNVVWNSVAERIVVQNPPTAQNWAIGVRGNKWLGRFPDYAEDGYWVSHWTPVEPQSLYEKQLEERLSEEGAGGLISLIRMQGRAATLEPGETTTLSVGRRGVRDGSIRIRLDVEGGDLLETGSLPDELFFPAGAMSASFPVTLREDAFLPSDGQIVIRPRHGPGYSVEPDQDVTIAVPARPWEAWLHEHFTAEEREDPSISGEEASPAGDEVSNLLKFALGLDPRAPVKRGDLPAVALEEGRGGIEFRRRTGAFLTYEVEVSEDLASWRAATEGFVTETDAIDSDWERVTVREEESGSIPSRFFRLRVAR